MEAAPSGVGAPAWPVLEKKDVKEPCFPKKFLHSMTTVACTYNYPTMLPTPCQAYDSFLNVNSIALDQHTQSQHIAQMIARAAGCNSQAHREDPGERTREV